MVDEFDLVGSYGSPTFGDPRYIMNNHAICKTISEQMAEKVSKVDITFSQNLDAADLLFLETTCTQTLERVRASFPQVIRESDWIIPEEQVRMLENIDYARMSKFEFQSDTEFLSAVSSSSEEEEEPSSPVKRRMSPHRPILDSQPLSHTQANSLPSIMTQPFTQEQPVNASSPVRYRVIGSSPVKVSTEVASSPLKSLSEAASAASPVKLFAKEPATPTKHLTSPVKSAGGSPVRLRTESQTSAAASPASLEPAVTAESEEAQKRAKLSNEPAEPPSSLSVRFPLSSLSPERKAAGAASPPRSVAAAIDFPDYSAW